MFDINVIVAINNIPEAKEKFMKGGLNATINMGHNTKTYPQGIKPVEQKKERIAKNKNSKTQD